MKRLFVAFEIQSEDFKQFCKIWDVDSGKYYSVDYEKVELIRETYEFINLYDYMIANASEIPEDDDIKKLRWFDFDTFFYYLFKKETILGINQQDTVIEDGYIKMRLFEMSAVGELPFKISIMTKPSILIKTAEEKEKLIVAKTIMIKLGSMFTSKTDKLNIIKNKLIEMNPDNKTFYIYKMSIMTHANHKNTIIRVRCAREDDEINDKNYNGEPS